MPIPAQNTSVPLISPSPGSAGTGSWAPCRFESLPAGLVHGWVLGAGLGTGLELGRDRLGKG